MNRDTISNLTGAAITKIRPVYTHKDTPLTDGLFLHVRVGLLENDVYDVQVRMDGPRTTEYVEGKSLAEDEVERAAWKLAVTLLNEALEMDEKLALLRSDRVLVRELGGSILHRQIQQPPTSPPASGR